MKRNWSNFPFDPSRWPFFYGWAILLWGSMGILMSVPGQTIGVSVFTDSLLEVLVISRDELSLAYMIGTIGSSFILPYAGRLYDRLGVRPVATMATVGLGVVLVVFSQIHVLIYDWLLLERNISIIAVLCVCFLFLRFFGQGVLTMVSRNMMMQWFDKRRGFATGFSNVFVALMFSGSPVVLYYFIESFTWQGAWLLMAGIGGIAFPVVIITFFRNRPEDSGLKPDGNFVGSVRRSRHLYPVVKEFTVRDAMHNYGFWVFALMLSMQGLYITGFTFHVLSIFDKAALTEEMAIRVFQPSAVIAVIITLSTSTLSDFIPLKYLYIFKGTGASLGILGVVLLGQWPIAYYLIVIGSGIMTGLFSVLTTVTWPRYYGRKHLGAITGQLMMMIVFGSALGPILFSLSLSQSGTYATGAWVCFGIYVVLTLASFMADNPQKRLNELL